MKKHLFSIAFSLAAFMPMGAQVVQQQEEPMANLDLLEDTAEVTTVQDIINQRQAVMTTNNQGEHVRNVWSSNTYFMLGYSMNKLTGKGIRINPEMPKLASNVKDKFGDMQFESDWGASLVLGHNYKLHKKPIANMVTINIDYTYIDLNFNHFKQQDPKVYGSGEYVYDSRNQWEKDNKEYYNKPWGMEMLEGDYSMALGLSLSCTPFQPLHIKELDYIKLNFYYHVGYGVSALFMLNDDDLDRNDEAGHSSDHEQMKDNLKLDFGHGMTKSLGFSLSWRFIGVGYEHRTCSFKYTSMTKKDFGDKTEKWDLNNNRVFLQFKL